MFVPVRLNHTAQLPLIGNMIERPYPVIRTHVLNRSKPMLGADGRVDWEAVTKRPDQIINGSSSNGTSTYRNLLNSN